MLPFLSLLDTRSRAKGSRDPLGSEASWSYVGRQMIGNLTTITGELNNFIVALLCCQYANEGEDNQQVIRKRFMRMEQLCAYLRNQHQSGGIIMGISLVKKRADSDSRLLGDSANAQILSNQLAYGLWGLYSTALSSAGLIENEKRLLTDSGRDLVQGILKNHESLWQSMKRCCDEVPKLDESLLEGMSSFKSLLANQVKRRQVVEALLKQNAHCVLQAEVYKMALAYLKLGHNVNTKPFLLWLKENDEVTEDLINRVDEALNLERILVCAEMIFSWLQGQKQNSVVSLVNTLTSKYSVADLKLIEPLDVKLPHLLFLQKIARSLNEGDFSTVIELLIDHNKKLMEARGGAAWLENRQGELQVRLRNDRAKLTKDSLEEYSHQMKNTYFVSSFLSICSEAVL